MRARRSIALSIATIAAVAALPAAGAAAKPDPTALVHTDQSKPVKVHRGKVRSVVGQAAITANGRLIVRLAGPNAAGVQGEEVLAQSRRKIDSAVSRPTKAKLTIKLTRRGRGTVTVIGPLNHTQPDAILYRLRWKTGRKPSIRIVSAHV